MSKSGSTKSAEDKRAEQSQGRSQEQARRPALSGLQADILALQDAVGNRAVSQVVHSRIENLSSSMVQRRSSTTKGVCPVCGKRGKGRCPDCGQPFMPLQGSEAMGAAPIQARLSRVRTVPRSGAGQPLDSATQAFVKPRLGDDFSQVRIHSTRPEMIQPKLTIGQPGDQFEREADRVADEVIEEKKEGMPQAKEVPGQTPEVTTDLQARIQSLRGAGQPLPDSARAFFGPRFNHDFSHVRIHTDARSADTARALNARAYTIGRDVVFAPGEYAPDTTRGCRLLAHELTHVVQQGVQYAPESATGHHLLAHELAHVVQQRQTGRPAIQRQAFGQAQCVPGVPIEKSSPDLERRYRARGDTRAADVMRACCREGGEACEKLLTPNEVWAMYQGERPIPVAAGAAAGLLTTPTPTPTPTPPRIPTPTPSLPGTDVARRPIGFRPPPQVATRPPPVTTRPTAPLISPAAVAGGLVGTYVAAGITDLINYGAFQRELIKLGFIILEEPLAICIRGCHTAQPTPKPLPFPEFPPIERTPPDWEAIERWLRKQPAPPRVGPELPTEPRQPDERRRKRCRPDPCPMPLPISWPAELPYPMDFPSPRLLIRTTKGDREWEGIDRGAAQRRFSEEIQEARRKLVPPPDPCFQDDAEPNAPYDAHHVHPLYLGGEDARYNLCALRSDRHQRGHPRLDNQTEWLDTYMACGICWGDLKKHPTGQMYEIVGSK